MSNRTKYPVIKEADYWNKVENNEKFIGFIDYGDGIYSFALSEVTIYRQQVSKSMGYKTESVAGRKINYHIYKPLRQFTNDSIIYNTNINPQKQDNRNPAKTIKTIYSVSQFYTNFEDNFRKYLIGYYDADARIEGLSHKPGYVSDSQTREKANTTNQWVNEYGVFYLDNYTDINTAEYANFILGCMIFGVGPENLVFPTNGTVSSTLKNSGIVKDALSKFYKKNKGKKDNLTTFSDEIAGTTLSNNFRSIFANGIFHPETLIGSAHVKIEQYDKKTLKVTVFNITSLTSGDFEKHTLWNDYPISLIRDKTQGSKKTEYGNTSQTYPFTIPIDFNRLK